MKAKRQPPESAIRPMTGAPIEYDRDAPALVHPTAFILFSKGKCSPISAKAIGMTVAVAKPVRE